MSSNRLSCFTDQLCLINQSARKSSSSGCVGVSPVLPRLFGFPASPLPKCQAQIRLTITLAVNGLSVAVSQFAKARRREPWLPGNAVGCIPPSVSAALNAPGVTGSPAEYASPFIKIVSVSRIPFSHGFAGARNRELTDFRSIVFPV